jgi:hypothetical protein
MKRNKNQVYDLGHVGVDSGQLIIVDPCYVDRLVDKYDEICERNHITQLHQLDFKPGLPGLAITFPTPDGDGRYPITVVKNKNGKPIQLVIDLDIYSKGGE